MNARPTEFRRASDMQAQRELERLLAARRIAENARAARHAANRERAMRLAERASYGRRHNDTPKPTAWDWAGMVSLSIALTALAWILAAWLPVIWSAS